MDRLLFISLVTVLAVPMPAQLFAQSSEASYTIAGDVPYAENFVRGAEQPVTVHDLLVFTNQHQTQGNSFILRGQPARAVWNEHCNPTMASQSQALQPGDVVVFRSLIEPQTTNQNVVLMTDEGNLFFQFPKPSQIQLGQLLEGRQLTSAVTVVRTSFESAKSIQLVATDLLAHGDVIDIRTVNANGPARTAMIADGTGGAVGNELASNEQPTSVLTIPSISQDAGTVKNGSQQSPFDFASNTALVDEAETSPFAVQDFDYGVSQSAEAAAVTTKPEANAVSPPSENASMWNALFVLGLVFALGLIVIGWVKTQQEQRQELEASQQLRTSISLNNEVNRPTSKHNSAVSLGSNEVKLAATASEHIPMPETAKKSEAPVVALDMTDELWVETEETTSSDLIGAPSIEDVDLVADIVDEDCPILSVGNDSKLQQHVFTVETLGEHLDISEAEVPALNDKVNQSDALSNALVGSDEWFGADWRTARGKGEADTEGKIDSQKFSQAEAESLLQSMEPAAVAGDSSDAFDDDDADADVDDTVVEVRQTRRQPVIEEEVGEDCGVDSNAELRGELEDLIHNRLPMNLQQIELPLRINLFGKPSGPKRLRIDGAHTQIAAPHMMSTARSGRRPQGMAISAGKKSVMESAIESNRTAKTPGPKPDTDTGLPGLDKALNFLDEQADS